MHDGDIRISLRFEVEMRHKHEPDTVVVDELALKQGRTRVDITVINGAMHGYEIKSSTDTLRRLPSQIVIYSQVLDYATIVMEDEHREYGSQMLPGWWGITIAQKLAKGILLMPHRPAKPNPLVDKRALAELLWHAETLEILRSRDAHQGLTKKPRCEAWDRLCECLTLDEIRLAVRQRLKERKRTLTETTQPIDGEPSRFYATPPVIQSRLGRPHKK